MQPAGQWPRVEVTGKLQRVAFPPVCINCAAEARQRVKVERVFVLESEETDGQEYETESVWIPLCDPCASCHRTELLSVPFTARIWPALRTQRTIAFLFPFLAFSFFAGKSLEYLLQGKLMTAAGMLIPAGFFGLIAGWLGAQLLSRFRHFGVPPDTPVSACFTFSRDRSRLFEPSRRRFRFRNPRFAESFAEINRPKLWDPRSAAASNAAAKRLILYAALIAGVALLLAWPFVQEWSGLD